MDILFPGSHINKSCSYANESGIENNRQLTRYPGEGESTTLFVTDLQLKQFWLMSFVNSFHPSASIISLDKISHVLRGQIIQIGLLLPGSTLF